MAMIAVELHQLVESGNFHGLIGEVENAEFECKAEPYVIAQEYGKRELAKDVSAFANADGGFIFIGVKTKQSDDHFGDEVEEIRPFPQSLVNTSQYDDILRAWIFPAVFGLKVSWIEINTDASRGIVVIEIPKQDSGIKPFVITITLDGKKHVETIFGYVQRKGDKNPPLEVKDLQRLLRSGIHYQENIDQQFASIQSQLITVIENSARNTVKTSTAKPLERRKQLEGRISNAIEYGNLKDGRLLVLSALPPGLHELKTIFLSDAGSIKRTLEYPPKVRQSGWSMETLDQAKILKGELIRVGNGVRKVIDLYRDGTMIFATKADSTFLAWGGNFLKINPLAFIEVVYSFVNLYLKVLADFTKVPGSMTFRIDLRNMHLEGKKTYLVPYGLKSLVQACEDEKKEAPDDTWHMVKTIDTAEYDVGAISFVLMREVYLWFGHDETKIPYQTTVDGLQVIDTDAIIHS